MLVLALDTATTRMTAGVVELPDDPADGAAGDPRELAVRSGDGARTHAEHLAPWIAAVLAEAGATPAGLDAVVCGVGPGPFTGLRVGMVSASALGDGLGLPVHGVGTHDALLAGSTGRVAAVTDARRREVYATVAHDGVRVAGPEVSTPADLLASGALDGVATAVGDAAAALAELGGPPAAEPVGPVPAGLVAVAAADLLAGRAPGPLVPRYLRRPDAVPPGAPKAVSR